MISSATQTSGLPLLLRVSPGKRTCSNPSALLEDGVAHPLALLELLAPPFPGRQVHPQPSPNGPGNGALRSLVALLLRVEELHALLPVDLDANLSKARKRHLNPLVPCPLRRMGQHDHRALPSRS